MKRRKPLLLASGAAVLAVTATACTLPKVPPYPYWGPYGSRQGVINKAQDISNKLEAYIKGWLDGRNSATIPADLVPDSAAKEGMTNFRLLRENEINPANQWIVRKQMRSIDWNNSPGLYPEPAATYLIKPDMWVPFGTKAIVTGQFPRARFFSIQPTQSFQPEFYYNKTGPSEVPLADADINPDQGSTNPFRVGANRNATARSYTVTLENRIGNSADFTPAMLPGNDFRAQGNTRPMSSILYAGPWGDPNYKDDSPLVNKTGLWQAGSIWIRYYLPDNNVNELGGVPYPKVVFQLPDGRRFGMTSDFSEKQRSMNLAEPIQAEAANPPSGECAATEGWHKNWGIVSSGLIGGQKLLNNGTFDPKYVRDTERGATGRDEAFRAPAGNESTASLVPWNHYFGRCMSVEPGKVAVITGRKPTTPRTRAGQATMTGAEARFWSITTYDDSLDPLNTSRPFGQPITSLIDEDVVDQGSGYYTIVYSQPGDRPSNATAGNGVTWKNWGPKGNSGFFLRWQSIGPEWTSAKAPNEVNMGRRTDDKSPQYDKSVIGKNDRSGWWKEYHPVIHYMTKAEFERLGTNVKWNQAPAWK